MTDKEKEIRDYLRFRQEVMCAVAHRILSYENLHRLAGKMDELSDIPQAPDVLRQEEDIRKKMSDAQAVCEESDKDIERIRTEVCRREDLIGEITKNDSPGYKDFKKIKKEIHRALSRAEI